MRRPVTLSLLLALALPAAAQEAPPPPPPAPSQPAPPPPAPAGHRVFYGGGFGVSFGTVEYVEVTPMIGFKVTPITHLGVSLLYRYRKDDRYDPSISTSDYGGNFFVRVFPYRGLFLEGNYEYVDYEYVFSDGSTARQGDSNVLAGAGFSQPMGDHGAFYASALYNFSYDSSDPFEPYDSPWVFRVGVGFGF
jgi:hypothetical protein